LTKPRYNYNFFKRFQAASVAEWVGSGPRKLATTQYINFRTIEPSNYRHTIVASWAVL